MKSQTAVFAIAIVAIAMLLSACAASKGTWLQAGVSDDRRRIDDMECSAEAREDRQTYIPDSRDRTAGQNLMTESRWESVLNLELYGRCMGERGWRRADD